MANPKGLLDPLYETMVFMCNNDTAHNRTFKPEMFCSAIVDACPVPLSFKAGGNREVMLEAVQYMLYAYLHMEESL